MKSECTFPVRNAFLMSSSWTYNFFILSAQDTSHITLRRYYQLLCKIRHGQWKQYYKWCFYKTNFWCYWDHKIYEEVSRLYFSYITCHNAIYLDEKTVQEAIEVLLDITLLRNLPIADGNPITSCLKISKILMS